MFDEMHDREESMPVARLARVLGKLGIAGIDKRAISHVSFINGFDQDIHAGRRFCFRLATMGSLTVDYVVLVPWKKRDTQFDHFYE